MIVAGITGSIGMGKTTAGDMLRHMGYPVHCSDAAVHALYDTYGAAVVPIASLFPEAYEKKTAKINRKKLGALMWEDEEIKAQVEAIVHPLVRGSQDEFCRRQRAQGHRLVFLDIPLLFETGAEARLDFTICVTAPFLVQKQRLMARPGMTEDKLDAILSAQMPDIEKRRKADFVVHSGLGRAPMFRQLRRVVRDISMDRVI